MSDRKKIRKNLSTLVALTLTISSASALTPMQAVYAQNISYTQNFETATDVPPAGWTIAPDSKYLMFNTYDGTPAGAPETVSGIAMNAVASGAGNRPAYVDLDSTVITPDSTQDYETFDFDFYMNGGVNTCNVLSLGNNQPNSYSDLSNTFFALANGDGVGARNTLRYYNYDTDSWVSIPNANNAWLKIKVYADFVNQKVKFNIKNADGTDIGTYGPFSFASKFTETTPLLSRIVMSGFRSNGGSVSLNTWIDNFHIASMDEKDTAFMNYAGIIPSGNCDIDYTLVDQDNETVLKTINNCSVEDPFKDSTLLRTVNADVMLTQLPVAGYQSVFQFNNSVNGNVVVGDDGILYNQQGASTYIPMLNDNKKIQAGQWYNINGNISFTSSENNAYYTFYITGDFGNGIETVEYTSKARNSDKFTKLNLSIGGALTDTETDGNVLFKDTLSISAIEKPILTASYDNTQGSILLGETDITSTSVISNHLGSDLTIKPMEGYQINTITLGDTDITERAHINPFTGTGVYTVPVVNSSATLNVTFIQKQPLAITQTITPQPFPLNPSDKWEVRRLASEARTIQVDYAKMAYRLFKPLNYDPESAESYPLVVFLRGARSGYDNLLQLDDVNAANVLTLGSNPVNFPCFILSPQCYDSSWDAYENINESMVLQLLEELEKEIPNLDTNRIYLCGNSEGGSSVWRLAKAAPDKFAAIAPIAGFAPEIEQTSFYLNVPIWSFYSLDDPYDTVPTSNTAIIESLQNQNANALATVYETGGHNAWYRAYDSPLFQWMFSKEKGNEQPNEYIDKLIQDYNSSLNPDLEIEYALDTEINNDNCTVQETKLGDIVTDAMLYYTNADIALTRSDDLGASIPAGNVTEETILNAFPNRQNTVIVELKGSDIFSLLTNSLAYLPESDGRFLQMSGLTVTFDPTLRPSQRILSVLVNDVELNLDQTYRVAVSDHLVSNNLNNTYNGILTVTEHYYQTITQMFVNYLNENNYNTLPVVGDRLVSVM